MSFRLKQRISSRPPASFSWIRFMKPERSVCCSPPVIHRLCFLSCPVKEWLSHCIYPLTNWRWNVTAALTGLGRVDWSTQRKHTKRFTLLSGTEVPTNVWLPRLVQFIASILRINCVETATFLTLNIFLISLPQKWMLLLSVFSPKLDYAC